MNPFEMVVLIVAIIVIGGLFKARYTGRANDENDPPFADSENLRLREEVRNLKERVEVLERIATDKAHALDREIEKLRDR